jgi:16S rRNA (uracil1498-N3)-methyltransferase
MLMKPHNKSSDRHLFALYAPRALSLVTAHYLDQQCAIRDADVWHRIAHVLHARVGEEFIFFDAEKVIQLQLTSLATKNTIEGILQSLDQPYSFLPRINLFQGLLKREAWADVTYYAAQMGVTRLIPLITTKTQREWGSDREMERMRNVMIAACEQAHQFIIPEIVHPITLAEEAFTHPQAPLLYCETGGTQFFTALTALVSTHPETINIVIGPEGGFTAEECLLLDRCGAQRMALTPSILRAQDAVAVCIGALRSALWNETLEQNTEI